MAAITASSVVRESLGSLTLLMVNLTTGSTSDTYTVSSNLQVVEFWAQGNTSVAGTVTTPDVTYVESTGVFTLVTASSAQGALTLFILARA